MALLEYYKDKQAKEKIDSDLRGNAQIKLLEPKQDPPVVGRDVITKTFYVRNEHDYPMGLEPTTTDADVIITDYPRYLEPDQIGKVELVFKPAPERLKPLDASWDFIKTVYHREYKDLE